MQNYAYASVGVNLNEFMQGRNPTTQPGVEIAYYSSMSAAFANAEFVSDGRNSASCMMMFDIDSVKCKLRPSKNQDILGYGTLQAQHIVDAMLEIKKYGISKSTYIDAGKCDWDKARETVREMNRTEFLKNALPTNSKDGISILATKFMQRYAQETLNNASQNHPLLYNRIIEGDILDKMQKAFLDAYHNTKGNAEKDKILAGTKAAEQVTWSHHVVESPMAVDVLFGDSEQAQVSTANITYDEFANVAKALTIEDANFCAGLNFAILPEQLQNTATYLYNSKMSELSIRRDFEFEPARYGATAIAYAWNKVIDRVQQEVPEIATKATQYAQQALQEAIYLGAKIDDMGLAATTTAPSGEYLDGEFIDNNEYDPGEL